MVILGWALTKHLLLNNIFGVRWREYTVSIAQQYLARYGLVWSCYCCTPSISTTIHHWSASDHLSQIWHLPTSRFLPDGRLHFGELRQALLDFIGEVHHAPSVWYILLTPALSPIPPTLTSCHLLYPFCKPVLPIEIITIRASPAPLQASPKSLFS